MSRILSILVFGLSLVVALGAAAQEYVPGEVIVRFKGQRGSVVSAQKAQQTISKLQAKGMSHKQSWSKLNMHRFQVKSGKGVGATVEELQQDSDVLYAEPNYIFKKASVNNGETEKRFSLSQVEAFTGGGGSGSGLGHTDAPIYATEAWDQMSSGGDVITIAIIDTGVDYTHEAFQESGALWTNPGEIAGNGIDDDGNGYVDDVNGWNFAYNNNAPMDDDGHGTHVAGLALGATQNIFALQASQSKVRIMPLKFLDNQGNGSTSAAIQAIYYALDNGAQVLNNSWGGGNYSAALHEAIAHSYDKGAAFIAASGNAGEDNDRYPMYPASYDVPNVLSVAASDDFDQLAFFSNFGSSSVDMGSPGVSILSTFPGDSYGYSSGTSMAAPIVSGMAALMVREKPGMSGYQVKSLVLNSSQKVSPLSGKVSTGARIHLLNAVLMAQGATIDNSQPEYSLQLSSNDRELASSFANNGAGGCGLVGLLKNGGGGPLQTGLIFALLFGLPVLIILLNRKTSVAARRTHQRYAIESDVSFKVGDKELIGSISSISQGGVQLNTEEMLDKGGIINLTISSPDGKEQIQVEGQIVWSEAQKSYGVAFAGAKPTVLQAIGGWTKGLIKS